ncbi:MAG: adenylate/guanylate cyclase domain-containing protein [Fidelibacterota bacterium]|jgi:class 3 adenylate cyclase
MPLFLDIHNLVDDLPPMKDIFEMHKVDLIEASKINADVPKYYINYESNIAFCVIEANSKEDAEKVHNKTLAPDKIIEVDPMMLDMFLGAGSVNEYDAATVQSKEGESQLDPGHRIILFTDLVGSTEMTHRLGDEDAMTLLRKHNSIIRNSLKINDGREIKHTGDGIMASFFIADKALEFSNRVQEDFFQFNKKNDFQDDLKIKIGLHSGFPVEENNDLFGTSVQVAARVCDHAGANQILLTHDAKEKCKNHNFELQHLESARFKGVSDEVSLYEFITKF